MKICSSLYKKLLMTEKLWRSLLVSICFTLWFSQVIFHKRLMLYWKLRACLCVNVWVYAGAWQAIQLTHFQPDFNVWVLEVCNACALLTSQLHVPWRGGNQDYKWWTMGVQSYSPSLTSRRMGPMQRRGEVTGCYHGHKLLDLLCLHFSRFKEDLELLTGHKLTFKVTFNP